MDMEYIEPVWICNEGGCRGNGKNLGTESNKVSGGGGGIYTVYTSTTWDKMPHTTDPQDYVNGDSV